MRNKKHSLILNFLLILILFTACGTSPKTSGDEEYENTIFTIEGEDIGTKEITLSELRELEQITLNGSYERTTGTIDEYVLEGPRVSDVIAAVGADITKYEGIGVVGSDGYYCLIPRDIIESTPDMLLGIIIDGEIKPEEALAPAMLGVQGQFGPYWVKKVSNIILYDNIPKKDIQTVWIFDNLVNGLPTYDYEYYGSKDKSIELIQVFSRFDEMDSRAFFTMKSSDGFKKNEVMNMIKPQYYIKVEGEDAPTNMAPYIKLGMNVKNISWFSTDKDAAIFPYQLEKYIDVETIAEKSGNTISEILYELEFESIRDKNFEFEDVNSEEILVSGEDLDKCILVINDDGTHSVVFDDTLELENIDNLMKISVSNDEIISSDSQDSNNEASSESNDDVVDNAENSEEINSADTELEEETDDIENTENVDSSADVDLGDTAIDKEDANAEIADETIDETLNEEIIEEVEYDLYMSFDGEEKGLLIEELIADSSLIAHANYSASNNFPVKKNYVASGIDLSLLVDREFGDKDIKAVKVSAKDGYYCSYTAEQFFETYNYPQSNELNYTNKVQVPTILSYTDEDGNMADLKIYIGQNGINEPNTLAMVSDVKNIEFFSQAPAIWEAPSIELEDFSVEKGTEIKFTHPTIDNVKIYYTTDGTNPNFDSQIFNPSTTYFQPDLINPIIIDEDTTIKAIAIGYGKYDSSIVTFEITVK